MGAKFLTYTWDPSHGNMVVIMSRADEPPRTFWNVPKLKYLQLLASPSPGKYYYYSLATRPSPGRPKAGHSKLGIDDTPLYNQLFNSGASFTHPFALVDATLGLVNSIKREIQLIKISTNSQLRDSYLSGIFQAYSNYQSLLGQAFPTFSKVFAFANTKSKKVYLENYIIRNVDTRLRKTLNLPEPVRTARARYQQIDDMIKAFYGKTN